MYLLNWRSHENIYNVMVAIVSRVSMFASFEIFFFRDTTIFSLSSWNKEEAKFSFHNLSRNQKLGDMGFMYHFNTGIFVYNLFRYIQYVNRHTLPSIGDESLKNNSSADLTRWNLHSRQDLKFYFLFYAFFKLLLDMRCPSI